MADSREPVGLFLYDDAVARGWQPFSLTRPVGELLFGCMPLRERAERALGLPCLGHLAGEGLVGFHEPGAAAVVRGTDVRQNRPRVLLCSRAALEGAAGGTGSGARHGTLHERIEGALGRIAATPLSVDGEVAGWVLPPGVPTPSSPELLRPGDSGPTVEPVPLKGRLLDHPWTLVDRNADRIRQDVLAGLLGPDRSHGTPGSVRDAQLPPGVHRLGDGLLSLGAGVEMEPGVVLDTRPGPIRLCDGVVVRAHARLEGPLYVGPNSVVLGGALSGVSIGAVCKIRGEVEGSVIGAFTNKAHDGFLGHAYLGSWVNLGAMTTNSDLKNNYGTVRVKSWDTEHDTGLLKVGCFLGDHVKTGIGTLLNTGTIVGAGSNLFGGAMPPGYVPPFSWGRGSDLGEYRLDRFLDTTERAMARRNVELSPGMRDLLARAWEATRGERTVPGAADATGESASGVP